MRKILYRGIREDNGELIESDSVLQYNGIIKLWDKIDGYVEIEPETVGQYTGLKDKRGKMIFEGDIVRYGDTTHKVVFEQRNGTAYFGLVYSMIETLPFGHYQDLNQIEVIGNIYKNPGLLKGE